MAELKLNIVAENLNKIKQQFENISIGKSGTKKDKTVTGPSANKSLGKLAFLAGGIFGFVAGLFSSLESVVGILKVIGGLINQLVAPFVPFLLTLLKPVTVLLAIVLGFMLKFFKDPVRSLLQLGIFIVNGVLTGLEVLINVIRRIFGLGAIELPRFQEQLVLQAYDTLQEDLTTAAEDGRVTFLEASDAFTKFGTGLINSFVKNSTFAKVVSTGIANGLDETFILGQILEKGASNVSNLFVTVFDNIAKFGTAIDQKIADAQQALGIETGRSFNQTFAQPLTGVGGIAPLLADIARQQIENIQTGRVTQNEININVEGSADMKTVQAAADMFRGQLNRQGGF